MAHYDTKKFTAAYQETNLVNNSQLLQEAWKSSLY